MNSDSEINELRRLRLRLRQLSRSANGRYQSKEERQREDAEKAKIGVAGIAGGAAIYGARNSAAARIGSLGPEGIRKVGDQLKKFPVRGSRILTGGALAEALKRIKS